MAMVADGGPPSSSGMGGSSDHDEAKPEQKGSVTIEKIATRKDELVRQLEKRSLQSMCFTYSLLPEKAEEHNRALEDDLDLILLDAHKHLATYRLYGEVNGNTFSRNRLSSLENMVKEAELCYERFQRAKKMNPNPRITAIVPIAGAEDLENRAKQSLIEQENVKRALDNLTDNCKRLLESSEHMRKMLRKLHEQNQLIFFKQVQVASLIDEVATFLGICVRDNVAEDIHTACLSQAASEFSVESWLNKIRECKDTMQGIRTEALTFFRQKESSASKERGLLTEDQRSSIQNTIAKNTNSILQLSRGAEVLCKQLEKNELSCLDLPDNVELRPVDLNDISRLEMTVTPAEGIWRDISIRFECLVPEGYPHERLRVRCVSKILHPNILGTNAPKCGGAVCLNIVREDWRPIYTVSTVAMGLLNLLLEPQIVEPLDEEAARLLSSNPERLRELNLDLNKNL